MSSVSYQTLGTYQGKDLIIDETYKPASFGRMINPHRSQPNELQDRLEMAASYCDMGNVAMGIRGTEQGNTYRLQVEWDVSDNPRLVRDSSMAATFCRLGAFFGFNPHATAGAATAAGQVPAPDGPPPPPPEDAEHESTLPPPSFLGDVARAIGNFFGLLADYAVLGAYIACGAMKRGVQRVIAALS